jgi:hypothetical protein
MDVETLDKGKKRLKTSTERKKGISFGGTLIGLDPGDLYLPTWMLAFEHPGCHHDRSKHHLELGFHIWGNL